MTHRVSAEIVQLGCRGFTPPPAAILLRPLQLELEKIKIGEVLEVILDDGEPLRNVPASFAEQGQEVLDIIKIGDKFCVKALKKN